MYVLLCSVTVALRLLALGIGLMQNGSKMQASVVPLTPVLVRSWGTGGSGFGPAVGRDRCFRTHANARPVDLKWSRTRLLFVHFGSAGRITLQVTYGLPEAR